MDSFCTLPHCGVRQVISFDNTVHERLNQHINNAFTFVKSALVHSLESDVVKQSVVKCVLCDLVIIQEGVDVGSIWFVENLAALNVMHMDHEIEEGYPATVKFRVIQNVLIDVLLLSCCRRLRPQDVFLHGISSRLQHRLFLAFGGAMQKDCGLWFRMQQRKHQVLEEELQAFRKSEIVGVPVGLSSTLHVSDIMEGRFRRQISIAISSVCFAMNTCDEDAKTVLRQVHCNLIDIEHSADIVASATLQTIIKQAARNFMYLERRMQNDILRNGSLYQVRTDVMDVVMLACCRGLDQRRALKERLDLAFGVNMEDLDEGSKTCVDKSNLHVVKKYMQVHKPTQCGISCGCGLRLHTMVIRGRNIQDLFALRL